MNNVIRVLIVKGSNDIPSFDLPENIQLTTCSQLNTLFEDEEEKVRPYDLVILNRSIEEDELPSLQYLAKAYCLFVTEHVILKGASMDIYRQKCGDVLFENQIESFLNAQAINYFERPYGEKFKPMAISIGVSYTGPVRWNGNYSVLLNGNYGSNYHQVAFWRNTIPIFENQALDLWLEYKKEKDVDIKLVCYQMAAGSLNKMLNRWEFDEIDLKDICCLDNLHSNGTLFFSLLAKGYGQLEIIALHDRHSRRGLGAFLPGGDRYVTEAREELFCYFDPGDLKPPLNIYFSGYKTAEGFEGYNLMRKMGCPFLLISEARMEGGSFYVGSQEFEEQLVSAIRHYMDVLNFTSDQVIMCGISMGTFGALYYGCDIRPHAMLLGKPLTSLGDIAMNERLNRPGGFPTSLDILAIHTNGIDQESVEDLNRRFWDKFEKSDWSRSKFVVSYMIEDDYDKNSYDNMTAHLQSAGVQIYGKGIHGRHNDNTNAIVGWFRSQFERLLIDDFEREVGK